MLSGCVTQHPRAQSSALATRVAVSAKLDLEPLDLSPDGAVRLLVRLKYYDAGGQRVHVPPGGHVDVFASRGEVQWQPRVRYCDPAAIVRLTEAGPLRLRVTSDLPRLPRVLRAATDTRAWRLPAVTAHALGPHVVVIGWFPRVRSGTIRISRRNADGVRQLVARISAPASSFRDTAVTPAAHYTYEIARPHADLIEVAVDLPRELPRSDASVMRGKAMWLSFADVTHWNVERMLDRAQTAGLHAIELRLTYGESEQITPVQKPTLDRFIDGAAARGIAIIGWTVPRAVTFEDLAASVDAAAYRTLNGHAISGLAVDLERGADFLANSNVSTPVENANASGSVENANPSGPIENANASGPVEAVERNPGAALANYIERLREAVGPHVLLAATVEDPNLERLTGADIPYAAIAAQADVLQPMTYWRMRGSGASISGLQAEFARSYALLQHLAGRPVQINIGGQTANLGNRYGAPPPAEVAASVATARNLGAIGETFFDWDGTTQQQWAAIAAAPWPL